MWYHVNDMNVVKMRIVTNENNQTKTIDDECMMKKNMKKKMLKKKTKKWFSFRVKTLILILFILNDNKFINIKSKKIA